MIARRTPGVLLVLALLSLAGPARAEEGLFVARVGGGISTAHPDMPDLGGLITLSMDLCVTEKTGVIGGTAITLGDRFDTVGLSLGVKRLFLEREWTRFYLFAAPELLLVWDDQDQPERHLDLAAHGGIGFEYLMLWGFGLVLELHGDLPAGLGDAEPYDAASVGLAGGIFMEF